MLPIKTTLLVNGISSGVTGIGLVLFSGPVASLFGLNTTAVFLYTGIFLVLFGTWVTAAALRKKIAPGTVKMITALDLAWVIASLIVVVADGHLITMTGNVLIIVIAVWVGLLAMLQFVGLRRLRNNDYHGAAVSAEAIA